MCLLEVYGDSAVATHDGKSRRKRNIEIQRTLFIHQKKRSSYSRFYTVTDAVLPV